jgi:hypothetical protein
LAQQKTIEAPEAILTLGKHGGRTAETVSVRQLKRMAGIGSSANANDSEDVDKPQSHCFKC